MAWILSFFRNPNLSPGVFSEVISLQKYFERKGELYRRKLIDSNVGANYYNVF